MNKKEIRIKVESLILNIDDLIKNNVSINSFEFKDWKEESTTILKIICGEDSQIYNRFISIKYRNTFSASVITLDGRKRSFNSGEDVFFLKTGLNSAKAILKASLLEIGEINDNTINVDPIEIIRNICIQFKKVAKQLEKRHDSRDTLIIKDEYDVQDLFHALLKIFYDDIRPEEYTPSLAGSSTRVDFILKKEKIAIELKKTRNNLKNKEVTNELAEDIVRYRSHKDCKLLICFVYDPDGYISNPHGLENDLNQEHEDLSVRVFVFPKE